MRESKPGPRRKSRRAVNRARTRKCQREAEWARKWLEHEARHGVIWVLIRGELVTLTREGDELSMCYSDLLGMRLMQYLKRKRRCYATLEEARFVLMPADVPLDGLAGAAPPGIRSGSE